MGKSERVGDSETYAVGYRHGLSAGIYNTLVWLENNGYISDSEFSELIRQIKQDNADDMEVKTDEQKDTEQN